jgi:sodium pump decarboxylase gamma subunit
MYSEALLTGKGVTLSEALATGGETTVVGLAIVFGVLIILMIVLMLFKVIFGKTPKTQTKADVKVAETVEAPQTAAEDVDEGELIAVLTAAVAASLNTSTYNLKIKSYRRLDNKMPAWNKAGVNETINNRF